MERWGGRISGEGVRMKTWNKMEMSRSGTEKELANASISDFVIVDEVWDHNNEDICTSVGGESANCLPKWGVYVK